MECIIFNVETPLNYDVGFPSNPECEGFDRSIVNLERKTYGILDEDTLEEKILGTLKTVRVRLSNIVPISKKNRGLIKYNILLVNNECGGVFNFIQKEMDNVYNRTYGDIVNIVTGETLSSWLIRRYPEDFKKYSLCK